MKIREVLVKFNKIVPFPWSVCKIEDAGFDSTILLHQISDELLKCEDSDDAVNAITTLLNEQLEETPENP